MCDICKTEKIDYNTSLCGMKLSVCSSCCDDVSKIGRITSKTTQKIRDSIFKRRIEKLIESKK